METGLKIADVARRSGFAPTTLRYYEDIGLVVPSERTPAGYRLYDESAVERLAFIARAKQLGCSLGEIADLVSAWEGGSCAPVQEHLRVLLESKVEEAQGQIAELLALTAQLQEARSGLDRHTPDGPCDDQCGCTTDAPPAGEVVAVALSSGPVQTSPVACTLDSNAMGSRLDEWKSLLSLVSSKRAVPGGLRLTFATDTSVAEIARLAEAEQDCCRFFSFTITMDDRGVGLEVAAPPGAEPIVASMFGIAS